jgi:hypothetical protein
LNQLAHRLDRQQDSNLLHYLRPRKADQSMSGRICSARRPRRKPRAIRSSWGTRATGIKPFDPHKLTACERMPSRAASLTGPPKRWIISRVVIGRHDSVVYMRRAIKIFFIYLLTDPMKAVLSSNPSTTTPSKPAKPESKGIT